MNVEEAKTFLASLERIPMTRHEVSKELIDKLNSTMKILRSESSVWYSTEDLPHEIWHDVVGYKGLYQVSFYGRAKSFYNNKVIVLANVLDGSGYVMWRLYKGGKPKMFKAHIVVARMFIPNPDNKPEVNHYHGDKLNNCVWTLEWVTPSENMKHSFKMGLEKSKRGCDSPNTNLTPEQVIEIRETCILGSRKFGAKALGKIYGISDASVLNIVHGKTYTEIGGRREVRYAGLSGEKKSWIREHHILGNREFGTRALARKFNVPRSTIQDVLKSNFT